MLGQALIAMVVFGVLTLSAGTPILQSQHCCGN